MSLVFNTPKTGLNTTTQCLQNMRSGGSMKLTDISVEYTKNGDYNVEIPEGYDGFSSVEVKVNVAGPGPSIFDGSFDEDGLREIGWTDEDIAYFESANQHFAWEDEKYLVTNENKALYTLDDPNPSIYKDDSKVTFVPNKNMESYFNTGGYSDMKYIKGIPFYNCTITSMNAMFRDCASLTTIPLIDTSNVTSMYNMFLGCSSLTTIPQLNTSNVTSMSNMFLGCSSLTTIPQLDTSNVTNMGGMFLGCSSLTTIPQLNTSNVTSMVSMFSNCESLTSIPQLDTSNVTNMERMFSSCSSLTTVEGIDFSGMTSNITSLFGYTSSMPKLTHFIVNGKINVSISDNYSIKTLTAIDYESVKSILEAANRTDNTDAKTLAFKRTMTDQDGELAALVASCATKGWTITGLTIN